MRQEIAQTAARMIAEGTAETFADAKRKAAEDLGMGSSRNMPENIAVHEALIEYQQLFGGDEHQGRITIMRREALAAMRSLGAFEPRLVGPVLYGTACDYSPITLHLYTDEIESVTRYFHDHEISYRLGEVQLKTGPRQYENFPNFTVPDKELDFDIIVMPLTFLAHPPLSSLDSKPFRRANAAAVEQLLDGVAQTGSRTSTD